jgi:hypothetical protein
MAVDTIAWIHNRTVLSVWFHSFNRIFACGDGIAIRNPDGLWQTIDTLPSYAKERIRGNHINDLFVVGHFGLVGHFNGISWKHFPDLSISGVYCSCDVKGTMMVAAGLLTNRKAVILRMWR